MNSQTEKSLASSGSLNLENSILKVCLKMYSVLNPTGNQCLSPTGLHQLLSVLAALCQDQTTKRKLTEFLELPRDTDSDDLNSAWHEYLTSVGENSTSPLNINFALFSFLNLDPTDELGLVVKNMYRGDMIRFESSPNKQVNDWIDRATAGVIKGIQLNINPITVKTLLVSALYFKAKWNKFLEWQVLPDLAFHVDENTSVKTNFLYEKGCRLEYAEDSKTELQALKLDYENRDYYLLILLPKDLNRLEKEMTASTEFLASLEFKYKYVSVYLPKFIISSKLDIMEMLWKIDPDLNGFHTGSKYGTFVTDIKQVNQIDVNEKGTEAASITCSMQTDGIGPKRIQFNANKPFVYLLCHKDTVLFTGRFCTPPEKNKN